MCMVLTLSTQFRENEPDEFSSFSITIETVPETALEGQEQVCCILRDHLGTLINVGRTLSMSKLTSQYVALKYRETYWLFTSAKSIR
jgi:hypothetical protein